MNVNCAEKILEEIIEDTLRDKGRVVLRKVDNTIHQTKSLSSEYRGLGCYHSSG